MNRLFAALILASCSCATAPFAGARSTGERLDVVTDRGVNAKSLPIPVIHEIAFWYPVQGASDVDEAAFYRIAGQPDVAKQIEETRQSWVTTGTAGGWLLGAGSLLLAGGGGTAIGVREMQLHDHNKHGAGLMISSIVAAGVGLISALAGGGAIGYSDLHLGDHVLSYQQAVDAANHYNRKVDSAH